MVPQQTSMGLCGLQNGFSFSSAGPGGELVARSVHSSPSPRMGTGSAPSQTPAPGMLTPHPDFTYLNRGVRCPRGDSSFQSLFSSSLNQVFQVSQGLQIQSGVVQSLKLRHKTRPHQQSALVTEASEAGSWLGSPSRLPPTRGTPAA